MIQIIPVFFGLLMVAVTSFTAPVKDPLGNVQIVYHVGDIVEHAYNSDAWNTNINPPNLLPNIPKLPPHNVAGVSQRNVSLQHRNRQNRPATETTTTARSTSARDSTTSKSTKITVNAQVGHHSPPSSSTTSTTTTSTTTTTAPPNAASTERSLESFLAMLDETRTMDTPRADGHKSDQKQSASLPVTTTTATPVVVARGGGGGAQQPPNNPSGAHDWAVYDDLDTQESNQTAVIASNQKFGYIVHGNNYKRFRVEEKNANGLITGLFGVHHNNGGFRGVQYAADPASINPKDLYDTLVKFLTL